MIRASYAWEDSNWTKEKTFHNENNQPLEKFLHYVASGGFPSIGDKIWHDRAMVTHPDCAFTSKDSTR